MSRSMIVSLRFIVCAGCLALGAKIGLAQGTLTTQQTQTTQTQTTQTTQTTETQTTQTSFVTGTGAAGVVVDASGVVRTEFFPDHTGQLMRQRLAAARAVLAANNPKVATPSAMRKISLNRLEAAIAEKMNAGLPLDEEMKYLAGLTRVEYIFYYPDTKDIVIAGPAEGWMPDLSGRVRGLNTLRPVVELEDLITALRAFPPTEKKGPMISVSIDPTPEGLQRLNHFLANYRPSSPNEEQFLVAKMRELLGLQNVTVKGIPNTTHFAQVLVEADYRMKLIGIGLERPPIKRFSNYVDRAAGGTANGLQRWYFVPDYQCVRVADDGLAMQMVGNGVKLVSADELVRADGSRQTSRRVDAASKAFTLAFTKRYPELASAIPVYAQLRNCVDLAVAAAFIQDRDYYGKAGWSMPLLGDEGALPVETRPAAEHVETAVNSVWKGNRLVTPIGGGVQISARQALKADNLLIDEDGKVEQTRQSVDLSQLEKGQWWWD